MLFRDNKKVYCVAIFSSRFFLLPVFHLPRTPFRDLPNLASWTCSVLTCTFTAQRSVQRCGYRGLSVKERKRNVPEEAPGENNVLTSLLSCSVQPCFQLDSEVHHAHMFCLRAHKLMQLETRFRKALRV